MNQKITPPVPDVAGTVYTVSRLNQSVHGLLEQHFSRLWVEGEISNFKRYPSGHWYFSLKDASAQVRCAMFRLENQALSFIPQDGMQVLAYARVSLYEERGDYQLIISHLTESGDGLLRRAFEALKVRLAQEGLFDIGHKKPLPQFPKRIGIITSATGAAVHDILTVLKRRTPGIPIIIYPTLVQGSEAKDQIVQMLALANKRRECDVLILARGGGSLEDLWPFNEEIVARAVYASQIPVVTGIGHEVDFTIADFVADQRSPTPSAAAALISPDRDECLRQIAAQQKHLTDFIHNEWRHYATLLHNLRKRLRHPAHYWREQAQRLDHYQHNLVKAHSHLLQQKQALLQYASHALDAVSPLHTLKRGYAIILHNQHIVHNVQQLKIGEKISARLSNGELACTVESISRVENINDK